MNNELHGGLSLEIKLWIIFGNWKGRKIERSSKSGIQIHIQIHTQIINTHIWYSFIVFVAMIT